MKYVVLFFYAIFLIITFPIKVIVKTIKLTIRIIKNKKERHKTEEISVKEQIYQKKNLMTSCEIEIYKKLKTITSQNKELILQSQIVLSSVINKITKNRYANELYRIVDFGIFKSNGEVLCLIELNDSTHLQYDRRIRDSKVKDILQEAQIPLITIWTNKENTIDYLEYRLQEYIA